MRRIVCAANKCSDLIVLGVRHHDKLMNDTINNLEDTGVINPKWEQGFVDNKGEFVTRTKAWRIALTANQIINRVGGDTAGGGTLYSENLY